MCSPRPCFAMLRRSATSLKPERRARSGVISARVTLPNRVHFDLALVHAIAPADLDVRVGPESNAAGDAASPHPITELLGEDHAQQKRLSIP
jgi:hypothetical protein